MRIPDTAMRTSAARVHQPWQVSTDGDHNSRRCSHTDIGEVQAQDAWSIKFSKTYCYLVPSTMAANLVRLQWLIFESKQCFVAVHLIRTSPERMHGQLLQLPRQYLLQTRDVLVSADQSPARTLTEGAALITPSIVVIEQHATMEHGRVSQVAVRAGPATVARKCGPAGPSRWLGPAWADHKSSWAAQQEDVPEDEPDVLYF
jgi:hypothetical protein